VLNGVRAYDPWVGGYLQVDPLVDSTWSSYVYVDSNPVGNANPTHIAQIGADTLADPFDELNILLRDYRPGPEKHQYSVSYEIFVSRPRFCLDLSARDNLIFVPSSPKTSVAGVGTSPTIDSTITYCVPETLLKPALISCSGSCGQPFKDIPCVIIPGDIIVTIAQIEDNTGPWDHDHRPRLIPGTFSDTVCEQ
jgi:hypothetical protein